MLFFLLACSEPPVVDAPTVHQPSPAVAPAEPQGIRPPQADGEQVVMPLNGLNVRITAHQLGGRPVWTLLSDGLPRQEVGFTVLRQAGVDLNPLLMFIQSAFDQGPKGAPGPWEIHGMSPEGPGFLARGRYYTVYFTPPLALPGVEGAEEALVGLLFDAHETEWLYKLGPQRLLGRLGRQYDQFPTAIWADPNRPVLVPPDQEDVGTLSAVPTVAARSLEVTERGSELRIAISDGDLDTLASRGSLTRPGPLRIFGGYAPDVRGRVVLDLTGEVEVHGAADGPLAMNGLYVAEGPEEVGRVEDLARVQVPTARWDAFWQAARARQSIQIGGRSVRFVEPGYPVEAPVSEEPARTAATIERFELALSETELSQVVDEEALRTAIGLMEVELIAYATEHPAPVPSMVVGVVFGPESTQVTPIFVSPPEDASWWPPLGEALGTVESPKPTREVPVRLLVSFR